MLVLVLLYWIGKYFYKLAEEYNKSQWGFAILGIVIYYIGTLLFGFLIGIIAESISPGFFEGFNDFILSLIILPFGILCSYILYKYLEKAWKNKSYLEGSIIDQIGVKEEDI